MELSADIVKMLLTLLPHPTFNGIILLEDKYQLLEQPLKCLPIAVLCPEISPKRSKQGAEVSTTMRTSLYPHKNNWQTTATPHPFPKLYYTCFEELLPEKMCNDKMNSVALCNWMYVLQITKSAYISKNSRIHTPGKGVFLSLQKLQISQTSHRNWNQYQKIVP